MTFQLLASSFHSHLTWNKIVNYSETLNSQQQMLFQDPGQFLQRGVILILEFLGQERKKGNKKTRT